jgi:hypothetical protein
MRTDVHARDGGPARNRAGPPSTLFRRGAGAGTAADDHLPGRVPPFSGNFPQPRYRGPILLAHARFVNVNNIRRVVHVTMHGV